MDKKLTHNLVKRRTNEVVRTYRGSQVSDKWQINGHREKEGEEE